MRLMELLREFNNGKIELPLMQRDYCWNNGKVEALLDSLFKGWPIGCFYVWSSTDEQDVRSSNKSTSDDIDHKYLLDGQQRLVSLQKALNPDETVVSGKAFYDLNRKRFKVVKQNNQAKNHIKWINDPAYIPLSRLIRINEHSNLMSNIRQVIQALQERYEEDQEDINAYEVNLQRIGTMLDCDVEYREYETENPENAVEIFTRLNSGKNLKKADKVAAQLAANSMGDVLRHMRKFLRRDDIRPYRWGMDFLTRILVTFHRNDASFFSGAKSSKTWSFKGGKAGAMRSWEQAEKSLLGVISILRNNIGWAERRWLPSANMLIPVAYAIRDTRRTMNDGDIDAIRSFLCVTAVSGVSQGSVESTINTYLRPFKKGGPIGNDKLWKLWKMIPEGRRIPIRPNKILNSWNRNSPLMKVYLAYLVKMNAKSWPDNKPIGAIASGKTSGSFDVHHIFPQQLGKSGGEKLQSCDLNTMSNYAIISDSGNREMGDQHPFDIFDNLTKKQQSQAELQFIPSYLYADIEDDQYEIFCKARSKEIAVGLNKFMHLED